MVPGMCGGQDSGIGADLPGPRDHSRVKYWPPSALTVSILNRVYPPVLRNKIPRCIRRGVTSITHGHSPTEKCRFNVGPTSETLARH